MSFLLRPWHILLETICGLLNQRQQQIIEFQNTQIDALLKKLGRKRLLHDDNPRRLLAVEEQDIGRKALFAVTFKITPTRCFKLLIQRSQRIHLWNRHEEVAASVVKQSFDMSLLIRTTHQAEVILKQEVALESLELRCHLTFPSPRDLPNGDFRVVEC